MARSETKMFIINTTEDLIEKFSKKKTPNTRIIDLDEQKQAVTDISGMVNLALLAELSEINSKIDQVYKRALDSPPDHRSKSIKMSKKSINSICAVCGDRAVGFNYDVLTCAPCKAFFRRNAHQNLEKLRCVTGENQCPIEQEIRRKCTRCRLVRCFAVGMRKDFILTEEELKLRRERLQHIRNLPTVNEPVTTSDSEVLSETLHDIDNMMMNVNNDMMEMEDWLSIEHIRSAFLSSFEDYRVNDCPVDYSNASTGFISWSHIFDGIALRFIRFLRQLDEFEHLHADDRFILIKYNLLSIYPICRCLNLESIDDYSSYDGNAILERHLRLLTLCGASTDINQTFVNMVLSLIQLSEQDSTVLILFMTICIFTQNLSMNKDEPVLNDSLAVHRAQIRFTTLLWNHLVNKRGEIKATEQIIQSMKTIFLIQSETKTFQQFFRVQVASPDTVDRVAPLLQTVLHIS